jgi:hypothetical protein
VVCQGTIIEATTSRKTIRRPLMSCLAITYAASEQISSDPTVMALVMNRLLNRNRQNPKSTWKRWKTPWRWPGLIRSGDHSAS